MSSPRNVDPCAAGPQQWPFSPPRPRARRRARHRPLRARRIARSSAAPAYSAAGLAGVASRWTPLRRPISALGSASARVAACLSKSSAGLEKLTREPCDKEAMFALGESLWRSTKAGCGRRLFGFFRRMPNGEGGKYRAAQLLLQLGDSERTVALPNSFIEQHPDVANYRYLRGKALFGAKRYADALADYRSTIQLAKESARRRRMGVHRNAADSCRAWPALRGGGGDPRLCRHRSFFAQHAEGAQADRGIFGAGLPAERRAAGPQKPLRRERRRMRGL